MCGINGIVRWSKLQDNDLSRLNSALKATVYRGPDYTGVYNDKFACLGHNRLSVLDLNERSNQPFISSDGRYQIVFNGEIYNFQELKQNLQKQGFFLKTSSDTEVILQGYIKYGKSVLGYLRGMFAFMIWDSEEQLLFMARDRFGEKPLFYHYNPIKKLFCFSSDLNGLRNLLDFEPTINPNAVYSLLQKQYIDTDDCIYNEISKLTPSFCLIINRTGNITIEKYWQPVYTSDNNIDFKTAQTQTTELLYNIIKEQLIADVPIGLFLSGGVDSGVIAAIAATLKPETHALTLTIPGDNVYDESVAASKMAKCIGIKHELIPISEDCIDALPLLLSHIEPLADSSILPSAAIAKAAKQDHFTVMLTGDGGDEIFGGYGLPVKIQNIKCKGNVFASFIINMVLTKRQFDPIWNRLSTTGILKWGGIKSYYTKNNISPSYASYLFLQTNNNLEVKWLQEATTYCKTESSYPFYIDLKSRLVSDFLFKTDTASMAYSIECRTPFLDYRLQEYVSRLPLKTLMPNNIDKELLKSIGITFYGKELMNLPKKGFSIPIRTYLLKSWSNKLIEYANEGLSEKHGILSSNGIKYMVERFSKRPDDVILGRVLYSVLVFETWLRSFHLRQI